MKRERDLGKLESFRKSLSNSLGSPEKHARELEFTRENGQFLKYVNDVVEAPVGVGQHLLGCGLALVASLKGTL